MKPHAVSKNVWWRKQPMLILEWSWALAGRRFAADPCDLPTPAALPVLVRNFPVWRKSAARIFSRAICWRKWRKPELGFMKTVEPDSVIDTSKMSLEQRAALELTEAARDSAHAERGFAGGLCVGLINIGQIQPIPQ